MALLLGACGGSSGQQPPTNQGAVGAGKIAAQRRAVTGPTGGAPTCDGTDVHAAHQSAGFACATCHPCGGQYGFSNIVRLDGSSEPSFPGGTTPAGGTIIPGTSTTPPTCSVACHYPLNAPAHTVDWTNTTIDCTSCHVTSLLAGHPVVSPTATRADCQVCHLMTAHTKGQVVLVSHPASWTDQTSPGFHAYSANAGIANCQQCHAPDLTGGVTNVACSQCHDQNLPAGVTSWKTNCVMCHGGTDNQTGAPPRATWGQGSDAVRIGAHTSHVTPSALAPAFDCSVCHVKPADALSSGHIDAATATVAFNGLALSPAGPAPSWDRTSGTCSNTYCHGATIGGGSNKTPVWTLVGQGEADCGTCHGVPPPPPHLAVTGLTSCNPCHPQTIDASGVLIPPSTGGKHLDGVVEAIGHDSTWMDQSNTNFHAYSANRAIAACTDCHGADLSGGGGIPGCANCHDQNLPAGVTTWKMNCVMCHGGSDNQTGAPPRATWGQGGDPIRIGAHTAHIASNAIAVPFDCGVCHVKPADALAAGHVDSSTATVTWSGLAITGGATPFWNRATATCSSTYCHGNYTGMYAYWGWDWATDSPLLNYIPYAGNNATPGWLDAPMTCDSCHGGPPRNGTWHSGSHGGAGSDLNDCSVCHPDAQGGTLGVALSITNTAMHVNGAVDVAPRWGSRCQGCH